MKLVGQVGGGEVDAAILGIGTRGDGGGVGGPHAGGRIAGGQHGGACLAAWASTLASLPVKPRRRRVADPVAPGGQHSLGHAELGQCLHLAQTLLGRLLRIGRLLGIVLGGDVAIGQAGIVVSRADQAVEVDLEVLH